MPDLNALAPDVDLLAVKIRDDVLTDVPNLRVDTRFPLDGADSPDGTQRVLVVARTTPGGGDLGNGLYAVNYTVDVWAPTRAVAFRVSDRVRAWLTMRGGRRIDDYGVLVRAVCTLRPSRDDDTSTRTDRHVRYVASYELTLRAAPTI